MRSQEGKDREILHSFKPKPPRPADAYRNGEIELLHILLFQHLVVVLLCLIWGYGLILRSLLLGFTEAFPTPSFSWKSTVSVCRVVCGVVCCVLLCTITNGQGQVYRLHGVMMMSL